MARKRKSDKNDDAENDAQAEEAASTEAEADSRSEEPGFSLDPLREAVEKTRQLVDWMNAAFEHRGEFPPQVVITVVRDYLAQYDGFVEDLKAAATAASVERKRLAESASSLSDAEKELEATIDELKLRKVIGELTPAQFDERVAQAREEADTGDLPRLRDSMEEIDGVLAEVGAVQAQVAEMRRNHEALEAGGEVAEEPPPAEDELGDAAYAAGGDQPDNDWEVGTGNAPAIPDAEADAGETMRPEGEDLMATGVISARPDIADSAPPVGGPDQLAPPAAEEAPGEGPRLLVVAPDVPEHVYPFTGEVMSMGRGRNNDIQIKNDGKISRYHCRIFRRGDEFIIEDNKSSNGTLVNGKLVTRQRLDGGEQVQIGETRMTFFL